MSDSIETKSTTSAEAEAKKLAAAEAEAKKLAAAEEAKKEKAAADAGTAAAAATAKKAEAAAGAPATTAEAKKAEEDEKKDAVPADAADAEAEEEEDDKKDVPATTEQVDAEAAKKAEEEDDKKDVPATTNGVAPSTLSKDNLQKVCDSLKSGIISINKIYTAALTELVKLPDNEGKVGEGEEVGEGKEGKILDAIQIFNGVLKENSNSSNGSDDDDGKSDSGEANGGLRCGGWAGSRSAQHVVGSDGVSKNVDIQFVLIGSVKIMLLSQQRRGSLHTRTAATATLFSQHLSKQMEHIGK